MSPATDAPLPRSPLLRAPGPSPVHPRILEALARPTIGHLDPRFLETMDDVSRRLRSVFGTENRLTFPNGGRMRRLSLALVLAAVPVLGACAAAVVPPVPHPVPAPEAEGVADLDDPFHPASRSPLAPPPPEAAAPPDPLATSPVLAHADFQGRVDFWVRFWSTRGASHFGRYLERMPRYQDVVDTEIATRELPPVLRYLPIVESGYNPGAVSRVGAAGLWQFMAPTARLKGLHVDPLLDERRDPLRSTPAALEYLADLKEQFGSWFLALAAYNAGPGRVGRILARHAPGAERNDELYWQIRRHLPAETREFVPRLFAAHRIALDPASHGFVGLTAEPALDFEEVTVPDATTLDVVALAADVPEEDVKALNPQLVRGLTPRGRPTQVRVPSGGAQRFAARYPQIPPEYRVSFMEHRVARGETFSHIARAYGVRLEELQAANPRVRPRAMQIGQRIVVPVAGSGRRAAEIRFAAAEGTAPAEAPRTPSGDEGEAVGAAAEAGEAGTLDGGGTVGSATGAEDDTARGSAAGSATSSGGSGGDVHRVHVVVRGETLWDIARAYGVQVGQLQAWNGLGARAVIRPGDELVVREGARVIVYRVQAGDTLSGIAARHRVSTGDLARFNGLSLRAVIRPGDRLRIPAGP